MAHRLPLCWQVGGLPTSNLEGRVTSMSRRVTSRWALHCAKQGARAIAVDFLRLEMLAALQTGGASGCPSTRPVDASADIVICSFALGYAPECRRTGPHHTSRRDARSAMFTRGRCARLETILRHRGDVFRSWIKLRTCGFARAGSPAVQHHRVVSGHPPSAMPSESDATFRNCLSRLASISALAQSAWVDAKSRVRRLLRTELVV